MRRFKLNRLVDVSGTSGAGIIAEGCLFSNGKIAMSWLGEHASTVWWDNVTSMEYVNLHGGNTVIEWEDL